MGFGGPRGEGGEVEGVAFTLFLSQFGIVLIATTMSQSVHGNNTAALVAPAVYTAAEIMLAETNLHKLAVIVALDDAAFNKQKLSGDGSTVHALLGVPNRKLHSSNSTMSVAAVRNAFRAHPGLLRVQGSDIAKYLLMGKVFCAHCRFDNARRGLIMKKSIIAEHADTCKLYEIFLQKQRTPAKQETITAALSAQSRKVEPDKRKRYLLEAYLLGNGMPPDMIERVFTQSFLRVLKDLPSGLGSASTLRQSDTPAAVRAVEEAIKHKLSGKAFSLAIDCGSANLVDGTKWLAIVALRPGLPDLVLGLFPRATHEVGEWQAQRLEEVRVKFDIQKDNIKFVACDNASVNPLTIKLLRKDPFRWPVEHTRCLPHCLNLVMEAFLLPFNNRFHISSFLHQARAFVKAGGVGGRRRALREWGLSLSNIDFSPTRWEGLMSAIIYMTSMQTDIELLRAKNLLEQSAKDGDKAAETALGDPGQPQSHWNAMYESYEWMESERRKKLKKAGKKYDMVLSKRKKSSAGSAGGRLEAGSNIQSAGGAGTDAGDTQDEKEEEEEEEEKEEDDREVDDEDASAEGEFFSEVQSTGTLLLDFLARIENWVAVAFLGKVLKRGVAVFRLIQGGAGWAGSKEDCGGDTGVEAVRSLITLLGSLEDDAKLKTYMDEIRAEAREQQKLVLTRLRSYGEAPAKLNVDAVLDSKEGVPPDFKNWKENREKGMVAVTATLQEALIALSSCAGRAKLEEALAGLVPRSNYMKLARPGAALHSDADPKRCRKFLGAPKEVKDSTVVAEYDALRDYLQARDDELVIVTPASSSSSSAGASSSGREPNPATKALVSALAFWEGLDASESSYPTICKLAVKNILRPVSSASVERIFSVLTRMDAPTRSNLVETSVHNLLFLQGNFAVVKELLDAEAARLPLGIMEESNDAEEGVKRRKTAEASAATAAAAAATAALAAFAHLVEGRGGSGGSDDDL